MTKEEKITDYGREQVADDKAQTESNRLMRGARRVRCEYILEFHTERTEAQVSCDGVADVYTCYGNVSY